MICSKCGGQNIKPRWYLHEILGYFCVDFNHKMGT